MMKASQLPSAPKSSPSTQTLIITGNIPSSQQQTSITEELLEKALTSTMMMMGDNNNQDCDMLLKEKPRAMTRVLHAMTSFSNHGSSADEIRQALVRIDVTLTTNGMINITPSVAIPPSCVMAPLQERSPSFLILHCLSAMMKSCPYTSQSLGWDNAVSDEEAWINAYEKGMFVIAIIAPVLCCAML